MILRNIPMFFLSAALVACGGGGGGGDGHAPQPIDNGPGIADLYYSYPADGQTLVAPNTPLVLGFLDATAAGRDDFRLTGPGGDVAFTLEYVHGGQSVVLTPTRPLAAHSHKRLVVPGLVRADGRPLFPDGSLDFTTRPALSGPLAARAIRPEFAVARMTPNGTDRPFLDFSSVRLTLTRPVDPHTVVYGDTLTLTQGGKPVPATVLVQRNAITIDPLNAREAEGEAGTRHDLQPGVPLTVTLTAGIRNRVGDALTPFTTEVLPLNTAPRALLAQRAAPAIASGSCLDQNVITSPLTGDAINCVPVVAHLLGTTTVSKQQGDVYVELANPLAFPRVTPLRIPRGSLLNGDPLKVLIGGHVNTGFDSGKVTVTFLSDASGYMMPNPYSTSPDAPRKLVLTMDVAFSTEDPRTNGAFNQSLLHIKLIGTAVNDIEKGSLVANAVGVVEPRVMGVENAYGVLSFHMESYPDQGSAPVRQKDRTPPTLKTWMPGDNVDKQRPGDPIILSFSEPLDRRSIRAGADHAGAANNLTLTADGVAVPFRWRLDGVDLIIEPHTPLAYGTVYQVRYTDTITDLAGNGLQPGSRRFSLPVYVGAGHAPVATTVYPGFPCAPDKTRWDIGAGDGGLCRGGESSDDHLPVMPMPANRVIRVQFSQTMARDSIRLGRTCDSGSFRVEKLALGADGQPVYTVEGGKKKYQCAAAVPGHLAYRARALVFTPEQPWQQGAYYRYVLMSENRDFTADDCRNGEALCSQGGFALHTAMLEAPASDEGGPNLVIPFVGAPATDNVFQVLRNLPAFDTNADFVHQNAEPQPQEDPAHPGQYRMPVNATRLSAVGTSGLIHSASVGCPADQHCPARSFIYLTGALDTQIRGYDASENAVRVDIYPTLLVTSSVDNYVKLLPWDPLDVSQLTIPTGPQIMRIRYGKDAEGHRTQPVTGWIRPGPEGPVFETTLDMYLSAPYLHPAALGLSLSHDLYSYPLTLKLAGAVTFLDDGRLQIKQLSAEAHDIKVNISLDSGGALKAGSMTLRIPAGGVDLNYVSAPIKQ